MRNNLNVLREIFTMLLSLVLLSGCGDKDRNLEVEDLGFEVATFYPSFLFFPERNDTIVKKVGYAFNEFATEKTSSVHLRFYHESENMKADSASPQFYVDGRRLADNRFHLTTDEYDKGELTVALVLPKDDTETWLRAFKSKKNRFVGLVEYAGGDIDRINNIEELNNRAVLTWSATQIVKMNPLKRGLYWAMFIILSSILFWLVLLRQIVFRRIKKSHFAITSPVYRKIRIRGATSLTLTNRLIKQPILKRVFKGHDKTYVDPFFDHPIVLTPLSRKSVRIITGKHYTITPFTTEIKSNHKYRLTNNITNKSININ